MTIRRRDVRSQAEAAGFTWAIERTHDWETMSIWLDHLEQRRWVDPPPTRVRLWQLKGMPLVLTEKTQVRWCKIDIDNTDVTQVTMTNEAWVCTDRLKHDVPSFITTSRIVMRSICLRCMAQSGRYLLCHEESCKKVTADDLPKGWKA